MFIKDNKSKGAILFTLLSIFLFFNLFFVSAVPPQEIINFNFEQGYTITPQEKEVLKQGQDYTINFFVLNRTNGYPIENTSTTCVFFMSDLRGNLFINSTVLYDEYWYYKINGGNFSDLGQYDYGIICINEEVNQGGAVVGKFTITPSGQGGTENTIFFIFIIAIIYGITFLGFFGRNIPITIAGGMFMMFLSIYLITNGIIIYRDNLTLYFSYFTLLLGVATSFWAIFEQFELL